MRVVPSVDASVPIELHTVDMSCQCDANVPVYHAAESLAMALESIVLEFVEVLRVMTAKVSVFPSEVYILSTAPDHNW